MTNSYIAIKGNFLHRLDEVFSVFKYIDKHQDEEFSGWDEFNEFLYQGYSEFASESIALKGIWFSNGWTMLIDPEMVDATDEDSLLKLSQTLQTEVRTFLIQTTSGSFGFAVYHEHIKRFFFASSGEVTDNLYNPLPEEAGLNINEKVFVDDILSLAKKIGIGLYGDEPHRYIVKKLAYNEELKADLKAFEQEDQNSQNKGVKPWWKIW